MLRATTLSLCILFAGPLAVHAQQGPAGVATDFVETREVTETLPVFAEIVARNGSAVAARVSGVVSDVLLRVGDPVEAGAIVASLDTELLEIDLRAARASASEARAVIEIARGGVLLAERAFARVDGLRGTNAFSQGQFDEREGELIRARGELQRAEALLLSAEAAVARAQYEFEQAVIRAPFDGVVLDMAVDPGEFIESGSEVALLVDIEQVEVEANVPAQYVGNLLPGLPLQGFTEAGAEIPLTVRAVLPIESSATRTRPVRLQADLSAIRGAVAVGQSITVNVPVTEARSAVLVPKDAVTQSRGAWTVFVHRDGQAVPQEVQIGQSFGTAFEVVSGLQPGDEVVVRGNERLRPMQPIAPQPVREAPAQSERGAADALPPEAPATDEKAREITDAAPRHAAVVD